METDIGRDHDEKVVDDNHRNLTRRNLFQRVGVAIAAAALPEAALIAAPSPSPVPNPAQADQASGPAKGGQAISPAMATLSTYMTEARNRALPDEVVEKAKHHILDTLAAMVSGSELTPGHAAIKFARAYGGKQVATVAGSTVVSGPIEAALTNGMLAHSDETDDSHGPSHSHPGCAVIPATLAVGEQFGIDGGHFLRAVVLGYDIGTRVTMTLGGERYENESHRSTHSFATHFGAAAAAGCVASLTAQQIRWLLDYTAQQCSGLTAWRRDTEHIEKAFVFAGMTARSGVTSALVVHSGWTGVDDILSGADNFFLAYAPQADPAGLVDKLGERYEITRTDIKKWSVGSPIQAVLDALQNLLKRHPFDAGQVQQVTVRLAPPEAVTVNNRQMPDICLQHMVAVMLIDKTVSFRAAHDQARMQDPGVLRQRAKVKLAPDEELARFLPQRQAIVELTLVDGTHLTERVEAVRGTAKNPMDRAEVVAKARDLVAPVLGESASASLIEKVLAVETIKDIRELRPLLQRA
jgi:2-methylcitrate dehydratase PrpD